MFNLGVKKGYTLVEIIKDNMIFVRNDLAHLLLLVKNIKIIGKNYIKIAKI